MSAVKDLEAELRTSVPGGIASLAEEDARDLLDAVRTAKAHQARELEVAVNTALDHIPRPLRGAVRKVIGL